MVSSIKEVRKVKVLDIIPGYNIGVNFAYKFGPLLKTKIKKSITKVIDLHCVKSH